MPKTTKRVFRGNRYTGSLKTASEKDKGDREGVISRTEPHSVSAYDQPNIGTAETRPNITNAHTLDNPSSSSTRTSSSQQKLSSYNYQGNIGSPKNGP